MAAKKEVVLVTGSSGCLGQFIIKLLQERDNNVEEIRLFDRRPYKNNLGHSEEKKMVEFIADIRNMETLFEAFEGVDCVIHAAAILDIISPLPNVKSLYANNVDGTQCVIDACIAKNVPRLIYASSTDMVCGTEHIFYGTESTTPIPTSFMIGPYGKTKCVAEDTVLKANGTLCENGAVLRTVALRPTPFYGENDRHFFYHVLRYTKKTKGFYYRIRSLDERLQITYVGNVAWAFIKAKEKLAVDETISGEAFFITDDTPIIDIHEHAQPFIEAQGFRVSAYILPYWLSWIILSLVCWFIWFVNIFYPVDIDVPSVNVLNYMCSTFFFNRSKATLRLDYQPIYTPEEAKERSLQYYSEVTIY